MELQQQVLEDPFLDVALLTAQTFDALFLTDEELMEGGGDHDFHSARSEHLRTISIKPHVFHILDG